MRSVSRQRLLVLFALFVAGFIAIHLINVKVMAVASGLGVLDLNFGNSAQNIRHTIAALGAEGRAIYLWQFYVVDFFYPLVYALFYSTGFRFLATRLPADFRFLGLVKHLWLLPWVAVAFDWLENAAIGVLLVSYPAGAAGWYLLANVGTVGKFAIISTVVFLLLVLLLIVLWHRRVQRRA